jgi:hypothetical protein
VNELAFGLNENFDDAPGPAGAAGAVVELVAAAAGGLRLPFPPFPRERCSRFLISASAISKSRFVG